jgi:hypothetical protein
MARLYEYRNLGGHWTKIGGPDSTFSDSTQRWRAFHHKYTSVGSEWKIGSRVLLMIYDDDVWEVRHLGEKL